MNQRIDEKINVVLANSFPFSIHWRNKDYKVTKVGLWHNLYEGKILFHVFSVLSGTLFFKIKLNTKHLEWTLLETSEDGI